MAAVFLGLGVLRVLFLNVARIAEENATQLNRRRICINWIAVALAHQTRQPAGVVQMRVRQHAPINRFRVNGKWIPIAILQFAISLKKSAVHQKPFAFRFHQVLRAGDTPGGAQKSEFGHRRGILDEVLCLM